MGAKKSKIAKVRDYRIDNIKVILIFLVVFGHLLEIFDAGGTYRIIYSFHMPAFLFTAGYFAKFNSRKIISNLIVPYVIFQILYAFFAAYVLNRDPASLEIQFTQPYWLLWYLFTLAIYYMLLPMMDTKHPWILLMICVGLALVAGFDNSIGYHLSLSRTLVFLPFFALGVVWQKSNIGVLASKVWLRILALGGVIVASIWLWQTDAIKNQMMYGSLSYNMIEGYSVEVRALLILIAFCWIITLMWVVPKWKIPFVTVLGENTLGIFLFHGFIQRYIGAYQPELFGNDLTRNFLVAVGIAAGIVIIFGNKLSGKIVKTCFTGVVVLGLFEKVEKAMGRKALENRSGIESQNRRVGESDVGS